jgi:hypothetical protein
MTIPNTTYQNSYTSSGGLTYAYTFKLLDAADIQVVVVDANGVEATKALNVDYTVTGVGNPSGGNVVFAVAPTAGYGVYLTRMPAATQETAFPEGDRFPAATVENSLDYLTMLIQGLNAIMGGMSVGKGGAWIKLLAAGHKIFWSSGIPSTKTWAEGDIALCSNPSITGVAAWLCAAGGTPGTWLAIPAATIYSAPFWTPEQFGAVGDGTTDDSVAVDACFAAAQASASKAIRLAQIYKVTTTQTITQPLLVVGMGRHTSGLKQFTAGANTLLVQTDSSCRFQDFGLLAGVIKTNGSGLHIEVPTNVNSGSVLDNLYISGQYYGCRMLRAAGWKIIDTDFVGSVLADLEVQNTHGVDEGDSCISGTLFGAGATSNGYGIIYRSSGGLRIENSKFLGKDYSIYMALTNTAVTGTLMIVGNSIEGAGVAAISLNGPSSSGNFHNIVISGNEIWPAGDGIETADTSATKAIRELNITGNNFNLAANKKAINLAQVSVASIDGNKITGTSGNTGIAIAATCEHVNVGINEYHTIATPISDSATDTIIAYSVQTGTVSISTSSLQVSPIYTGTAAITFPQAFAVAPTMILCNPVSNTNGAVAAAYDSGVSVSGATLRAWGTTNAGSVTVRWVAHGIIAHA